MVVTLTKLRIDEYSFESENNPYERDDTTTRIHLAKIAQQISTEINNVSTHGKLIIRGIQSGKHNVDKNMLLHTIAERGQEYENIVETNTIFGALFEDSGTVQHILEGFHKYKPKSEERPHYPVDIWLVFDAGAYENIEYLHPRHNVLTRDKWKRVHPADAGLLAIIVIE